MYATLEQMQEINRIQLQIFVQVDKICRQLGIVYFMVHGSLLGTVRDGKFVPYDDDIDIAMKRSDYELFLKKAPELIDSPYFIQSTSSDPAYPLIFAKVRDCSTTYICETVKKLPMNHGIYIDIFPIDYVKEHEHLGKKFLKKIYNLRIGASLYYEKMSFAQKTKYLIACMLIPSVQKAIFLREQLYQNTEESEWICITGGKTSEERIPAEWFAGIRQMQFEGIPVFVPPMYDSYLCHMYGAYKTRTLVEDKLRGERVKLNACLVDVEKPYTDYYDQTIAEKSND